MAKKEPRGTRDMNSGRSQDRNRGNGGNRGNERESIGSGSRISPSRSGARWMDREPSGGRGMETRHAARGRDAKETSHGMSRYDMTENERGSSREWGGGRSSGRGQRGGGHFPMDNLTYNVVTILHEKSKGLEAFDR